MGGLELGRIRPLFFAKATTGAFSPSVANFVLVLSVGVVIAPSFAYALTIESLVAFAYQLLRRSKTWVIVVGRRGQGRLGRSRGLGSGLARSRGSRWLGRSRGNGSGCGGVGRRWNSRHPCGGRPAHIVDVRKQGELLAWCAGAIPEAGGRALGRGVWRAGRALLPDGLVSATRGERYSAVLHVHALGHRFTSIVLDREVLVDAAR